MHELHHRQGHVSHHPYPASGRSNDDCRGRGVLSQSVPALRGVRTSIAVVEPVMLRAEGGLKGQFPRARMGTPTYRHVLVEDFILSC